MCPDVIAMCWRAQQRARPTMEKVCKELARLRDGSGSGQSEAHLDYGSHDSISPEEVTSLSVVRLDTISERAPEEDRAARVLERTRQARPLEQPADVELRRPSGGSGSRRV